MKPDEVYVCDHLPGEELVPVHKYNDRQYTVEAQKSKRRFLVHKDMFSEPQLSLAHVGREQKTLRRIR